MNPKPAAPRRDLVERLLARPAVGSRAPSCQSPARVEKWYSTGPCLRLQAHVTPLTNRIPVALLLISAYFATCIVVARGAVCGEVSDRARGALSLMAATAVIYLVFLITYGLHYCRVPHSSASSITATPASPGPPPWRWRARLLRR